MNPQHTHPYPEVEFDQDGKLTAEGEARAAIKSLPEGELLDQIEKLEAKYGAFTKKYRRFTQWAGTAIQIARQQFALTARAYQAELANQAALAIQADTQKEFYRLREEQRLLRQFLALNFENQLNQAVAQNKPLMKLVEELLVQK